MAWRSERRRQKKQREKERRVGYGFEGGEWREIKPGRVRRDVGGQPAIAVTPLVQLGAPPPPPIPSPECARNQDRPASGPAGNHSLQTNEV